MSKRIDLTEKLSFESNPVIVIKGKEIEINDDAMNVLKLMGLSQTVGTSVEGIQQMADLLFTENGLKALNSLKLNMADYMQVIEAAMTLATGEADEDQDPMTASTT